MTDSRGPLVILAGRQGCTSRVAHPFEKTQHPGPPLSASAALAARGEVVCALGAPAHAWEMQFHGGVYRSDDAGVSWQDIGGGGLPSDFGFPLMVDPADPDSAFAIPLNADLDRVTLEGRVCVRGQGVRQRAGCASEGRVCVYETRDGGSSWTARGDGLRAQHAYLTVLRQAFSRVGSGPDLQLCFGATSGEIFGSGDVGVTWSTVATKLPPVYLVVAV